VNIIHYEETVNRKYYVLIAVAILLLNTSSISNSIISAYGQKSTVISSMAQVDPSLESQENKQLLASPGPSAREIGTLEEEQFDTGDDGSTEKSAQMEQVKQNKEEGLFGNTVEDDTNENGLFGNTVEDDTNENGLFGNTVEDDTNENLFTLQSEESQVEEDQSKDESQVEEDQSKDESQVEEDQSKDDKQESSFEDEDDNDDQSEKENDIPLDFEATTGLPFP
jgi:hypothetical protein